MSTNPAKGTPELTAKLANVADKLEQLTSGEAQRKGAPFIRKGESALTSRGYSFCKLFQLMSKKIESSDAKVEVDLHNRLQKQLHEQYGYHKEANTVLAPFASQFLPQTNETERKFASEVRDVVKAGVLGLDLDELRAVNKTLSWTDESALGALVTPPTVGELIEVFRNNEVFLKAGATSIGLPPNGRMVFPRQTGATTAYYLGENTAITASEPTTGELVLSAKKLAALVKMPNELIRYASIAVEAFIRMDLTKVLGLKMDKELLEGVGTSISPKGIINYSGITSHTSAGTPADGNSGYPLQPEDIYKMIAKVEEQNAVFKSWIMRPLEYAYVVNRRADAVTAGDSKGPYLFNIVREVGGNFGVDRDSVGNLAGYPVHKSTQISGSRTRGSGSTSNTYILGGDFSDYVVAMSPTIEFAMTQQSDTAFQNDQTWLRAILSHDGAPRHEASFVICDQLLY